MEERLLTPQPLASPNSIRKTLALLRLAEQLDQADKQIKVARASEAGWQFRHKMLLAMGTQRVGVN